LQDQIRSRTKFLILRTFPRNSSSQIPFYCVYSGAVGRLWSGFINPAIFSQPTFLTNIRTALFEKEIWNEKPPRLRCSKMPRIWKEKSALMSCVHFTRIIGLIWHYLKKILRIRILRRVRRMERLFLRAAPSPPFNRTLIPKLLLRWVWIFRRTAALFRQIRTFPQLFRFCSDLGNSGIRQIVRNSMMICSKMCFTKTESVQ